MKKYTLRILPDGDYHNIMKVTRANYQVFIPIEVKFQDTQTNFPGQWSIFLDNPPPNFIILKPAVYTKHAQTVSSASHYASSNFELVY